MAVGNAAVSALLHSPLHRLLSGSTDVVRYTGRRSGKQFTTPTQYVRHGDDVIILVGRPETKSWWRNFSADRDIDVLVQRRWIPMTARAVVGAEEPETIAPLLAAYLERFPKAARALGGATAESRARQAVVVWCRPR
jgi:deazaflavin-dependent oxidoreductase (nitroreductase family)